MYQADPDEVSHMARNDRTRERAVQNLAGQARAERVAGRLQSALNLQGQAVALAEELARSHPGDPRYSQAVAAEKYQLGSLQSVNGQHEQSIATLEDAKARYASLAGQRGMPDTRPLVADVEVRRALALAVWGRGASAVPAAATAVRAYGQLHAGGGQPGGGQSVAADFARVLADNARILFWHGDPDMAVASADMALRLYLSRRAGSGQFAIDQGNVPYLVTAASVAAVLHGRAGRMDTGLTPAALALQWGGLNPMYDQVNSVGMQMTAMTPAQRVPIMTGVADVLREPVSTRLQRPAAGDAAITILARNLTILETSIQQPPPAVTDEVEVARHVTLAEAISRAGQPDLASAVTRPAMDVAIITPYDRCSPQVAPAHALRLAETALSRFDSAPADAMRMGLEAHYLYAAASDPQTVSMRYEFASFGPAWARVLLACSRYAIDHGEPQLAVDLASWAAGAAQQLMPFALVSDELRTLTRGCYEQLGTALIAAGDRPSGEAALATAAQMWPTAV